MKTSCWWWWWWFSCKHLEVYFHVLEKEMATHSSVLAWRIPGTGAAVYGVAQSRTRLKRLSSSSSSRGCTLCVVPVGAEDQIMEEVREINGQIMEEVKEITSQ